MRYLPFLKGKYTVSPGLRPLRKADDAYDRRIFQIDDKWQRYFDNKILCRQERLDKYYVTSVIDKPAMKVINDFMVNELVTSYPDQFELKDEDRLFCDLSKETISLDNKRYASGAEPYASLFDALCSQVQEDLAVVKFDDRQDWLATLHLCAPNYWSAEEKCGKNFDSIHEIVPGMERLRRHYQAMLQSVFDKGPLYRFGWGISTDDRLNHHPNPPVGVSPENWIGRQFDPRKPKLYVRVERQTLTGFPKVNALLFTIRTYFYAVATLSDEERQSMAQAIGSMSEATLKYKGLVKDKESILAYLTRIRH